MVYSSLSIFCNNHQSSQNKETGRRKGHVIDFAPAYLRIVAAFTSIAIFCWVGSHMLFCPWTFSFAKDMSCYQISDDGLFTPELEYITCANDQSWKQFAYLQYQYLLFVSKLSHYRPNTSNAIGRTTSPLTHSFFTLQTVFLFVTSTLLFLPFTQRTLFSLSTYYPILRK